MARFVLICNINCDTVIELEGIVRAGGRLDGRNLGQRLGGAGANAGSALSLAGHHVEVACCVGCDARGDWLINEADKLGIGTRLVERVPGVTPEVLLLRQPGGERTIVFVDRRAPWTPAATLLAESPDVLFVNSPSGDVAQIMQMACARSNLLVAAQLPGKLLPLWPAEILIGAENDLDASLLADPFAAGYAMAGDYLRWVIVTRGVAGATAYGKESRVDVASVPAPCVVDTTGAGDVFAAGLLARLIVGEPIEVALRTAAHWAACAVASDTSVAPPALRELLNDRSR